MNTATKLGGFAAGLVLAFGAAAGAGALLGPVRSAAPDAADPAHTDVQVQSPPTTAGATAPTELTQPTELPGGLMISDEGYTLTLGGSTASPGTSVPLRFRILGPDGQAQTAYEATHDKDLHLILVRRDMTGYQHLHPVLSDDGTWSVPVDLEPGQWRLFADFTPVGGPAMVLGADLAVDGEYSAQPLPEPRTTAEVDGYEVHLDGALLPGRASELTLTVTKDGVPVTDLEPYLGAAGHLVALRGGDLAYLHVHPGDGLEFGAEVPSTGTYHLFLDFRHDGAVRTAEFVLEAS
jgi:hypothetical protein